MADLSEIVDDLRAESDELDALVAPLEDARWAEPTPAAGWTIAHQVGHLLWTDRGALVAVTDEDAFADVVKTAVEDPLGFVNTAADQLAAVPPAELLADWRLTRTRLHDALLTVADGRKLPWFGPPMSGPSMATARLMETWAHGLDVADALGVTRPATAPLGSSAPLGGRARLPPGCARSRTSGYGPGISRSASTASSRRAIRSGWSCGPPTAVPGRGGRPMRRSGAPGLPRTS